MKAAKAAYDAYREAAGGKSLATGDPLPEFEQLPEAIQAAWVAAAAAARQAPADTKVDENGRTVLPLRHPIKHGEQLVTELRFRKAKGKDMRGLPLEHRKFGDVLDIVAKLSGQPTAVIDELSDEDLQEVSSLAGVF